MVVREFNQGLKILDGDDLRLVGGGEQLANTKIFAITPESDTLFKVWTQEGGQFMYDSKEDRLWHHKDYSAELQGVVDAGYRLYHAAQLPDGSLAIGTLGQGLLFVDPDGNIIARYDESNGLPDNSINYVYVTEEGNLWLALNNEGLAYMSKDMAVTRYGRHHGIAGYINSIDELGGDMALSTGSKLFRFTSDQALYNPDPLSDYVSAYAGSRLVWDFHADGPFSVIATEEFVTVTTSDKVEPDVDGKDNPCYFNQDKVGGQAFKLYPLERGRALIGHDSGVALLRYSHEGCSLDPFAREVDTEVRSIGRQGDTWWLGSKFEGIFRVRERRDGTFDATHFDTIGLKGLPSLDLEVTEVGEEVVFYNTTGVFRFDETSDRFYRWEGLTPTATGSASLDMIAESPDRSIWLMYSDSVVVAHPTNDHIYIRSNIPALEFARTSTSDVYFESPDVVWFNDSDELIKYDRRFEFDSKRTFRTLVGQVVVQASGDTLFHGNFATADSGFGLVQTRVPEVAFVDRVLNVVLGATYFYSDAGVQHRYRIEGADLGWSEWSSDNELTLREVAREGHYTAQFQSRDAMGRLSEVASYSYTVLPPFYRTWLAYLAYVLGGIFISLAGQKFILMRRAHRIASEQARELEQERRVVRKLQEANDRLKQANKLKDEFLATTSHELRTPLTAILGFTSILKDEMDSADEKHEFLDIIEESGARLMETLNSLLDLAKLRAGIMELEPEVTEVFFLGQNVVTEQLSAARRKGVTLEVIKPERPLLALTDNHAFSRALHHLVGNAIKFTEKGGAVEVSFTSEVLPADADSGDVSSGAFLQRRKDRDAVAPESSGENRLGLSTDQHVIWVHVKDTGIGIDEQFLPDLFEEYAQESDGLSRTYEGSGLGLAITSRMVALMHGRMKVTSIKGEGSTFSFAVPQVSQTDALRLPAFGQGRQRV